jgi:hypothetical protein
MVTLFLLLSAPPFVVAVVMDWLRARASRPKATLIRPGHPVSFSETSLLGPHAHGALLRAPGEYADPRSTTHLGARGDEVVERVG